MAGSTHTITLKFTGKDQVSATINKTSRGIQVLGKGLNTFSQRMSKTTVQGGGFVKTLSAITAGGRTAVNTFMNFSNSLRLAAQGMMSIGKSMTLFLTPAIFLIIKKAADVAIGFDAALVRVSKTTQLTGARLKELALGIREMGVTTATSQVDLAKMAEQIGQLGVRDVPAILSLIDTFNMLTMATDISADKVANSMGKIANAFGIDLNTEEGAAQIALLSSVINRLENDFAAAAPEILAALENFAQVGSLIEFPPEAGAAFVTALIDVGFGAEEAGTALRNMTIKVVQNADEVAQLMSATEGYGDAQAVMNAINEDAVQVLTDLVHAASMGDERAQALFATIEAGGIRGGKAWAAMAGGIDTFDRALAVANDEVASGMSLWYEYQAALLSTENQLKVLRNNVSEIALVLGDTLLPVINEIVQMTIPAIRWLAEEFKRLSPEVKKAILVVALLLGVAGPLILFLSQIGFGIAMVMMSFGRALQVIGSLSMGFIKLGGAIVGITGSIGGLLTAGNLMVTGLVAGIAFLVLRFTGLGKILSDFFINLGERAKAWGENLIITYGAGMLSAAVSVLARVLSAIGNFIGRFLAGSSPPDVGPLSHIDKWGRNVFDAFLGGFLKADFGILQQVGNIIEKVFATLAKTELIGDKAQFKFAMQARQDLAKLINIFNDTGQVAQDVLNDITANLGEAADEVQELIRLWLDYNRIQKELAEIEKQREAVLDLYRQEIQLIAQSNMTAEEKADAIREAMRDRDEELRILAQEERELEKQKDIAQEQLETQKAMIEAMQHQDDLQAKLIDSLEKMSGALNALGDFEFPSLAALDTGAWQEELENTYEDIVTLEERIGMMSVVWDAFLAGFQGEALNIAGFLAENLTPKEIELAQFYGLENIDPDLAEIVGKMERMHELGGDVGGVWENISGFIEDAKTFISDLTEGKIDILPEGLGDSIKDIADALGPIADFFTNNLDEILIFLGTFALLKPILGAIAGFSFAGLTGFLTSGALGNLGAFITLIPTALSSGGIMGIMTLLVTLLGPVTALAGALALLVTVLITKGPQAWQTLKDLWFILKFKLMEFLSKAGVWAGEVVEGVIEWFEGIGEGLKGAGESIIAWWEETTAVAGEGWEDVKEKISDAWEGIKETIDTKVEEIKTAISTKWEEIATIISTWWDEITTVTGAKWDEITTALGTKIEEIVTLVATKWEEITTAISTAWEASETVTSEKWEEIKTAIGTKIAEIVTAVTTKWEEITTAISTAWETAKTTTGTKIDEIKTTVEAKWLLVKTAIDTKAEEIKTMLSEKWDDVKTTVEEKIKDWVAVIEEGWEDFKTAGADLISGVVTGITSKTEAVVGALREIYNTALAWWNKIWGLGSPSKVMFESGKFIVRGAVEGIESMSEEFKLALGASTGGLFGEAGGLDLEPAFDFGGAIPQSVNAVTGDGSNPSITLQFGKDSVRSDQDIEDIAEAVERVLAQRAEGNMSVGMAFGEEL